MANKSDANGRKGALHRSLNNLCNAGAGEFVPIQGALPVHTRWVAAITAVHFRIERLSCSPVIIGDNLSFSLSAASYGRLCHAIQVDSHPERDADGGHSWRNNRIDDES
jgi:hypothetical protein